MEYTLIITEAAETDIISAFQWYEEQKGSLGADFKIQISKTIQAIQINPLKIQKRYNHIRVIFTKKFPYGIHYKISKNQIIILAIFHTSMNPKKWKF